MDTISTTLICIIKDAVHGRIFEQSSNLSPDQLQSLLRLAREQKLLPMVCEALYGSMALDGQTAAEARRQAALQLMKDSSFASLYSRLTEAGLTIVPVKGVLCSSLYPAGELRLSGDADLLVPTDEFVTCCGKLTELGFHTDTNLAEDPLPFEITFNAADGGVRLELHSTLFNPESELFAGLNEYFSSSFRRLQTYQTAFAPITGMNPHDHMLYLFAHAFKHFVSGGFGLRQLCDIGLWAETYADRIDRPLLYQQLSPIRAEYFAKTAMTAAQLYLGLADNVRPAADVRPEDCEALMEDMLAGGIYGTKDKDHQHAGGVTLRAAERGRGGRGAVLHAVFPSAGQLSGSYPFLKKAPYLLPLAWAGRIGHYGIGLVSGREKSRADISMKLAEERTALLRRFDIID